MWEEEGTGSWAWLVPVKQDLLGPRDVCGADGPSPFRGCQTLAVLEFSVQESMGSVGATSH